MWLTRRWLRATANHPAHYLSRLRALMNLALLPRVLVIVLLVAVVEGDQLLGAVDHGLDVDAALGQPRGKALDLG